MSPTILTLKRELTVPLETEILTPDTVAPLRHDAVCALPIFLGKRQHRIDDFFTVEGDGSDEIEVRGDCGRVKWIGRGMTRGRIRIAGNAGMHLGAFMKGGTIEVTGDASDWVGAEMTNGLIRIAGDAGGQIGAAYRGSPWGMNGGMIIIEGLAGMEVGMRMKRGTIVIKGPVRDFAGLQMKGGTLFLLGGAEIRTGAWMVRGTIISMKPLRLLPTFAHACAYLPSFLGIFTRRLRDLGVNLPCAASEGAYDRFSGDAAVPGKGEILVWRPTANGAN
jgi:formylmethanofuran dehydrogenase subunit C